MANGFQLLNVQLNDPLRKTASDQIREFTEIYRNYDRQQVAEQANRPPKYGNPYYKWKCLLHSFIPNWLNLIPRMMEAESLQPKLSTSHSRLTIPKFKPAVIWFEAPISWSPPFMKVAQRLRALWIFWQYN